MYYLTFVRTTDTTETAQLTFEDLFNADGTLKTIEMLPYAERVSERAYRTIKTPILMSRYEAHIERRASCVEQTFAARLAEYRGKDMHEFYETFSIPKHSGGFRTINAPKEDLKRLQREIKDCLEGSGVHSHTAAYAYVKYRTAKDAVVRHQKTGHTCYLKLDFHDFFGSCNVETITKSLRVIPLFTMLSEEFMADLLHIAMLDGGLPQGTPLSPWLTNQIMLPYDYEISNECTRRGITDTRYAEDMLISADNKTALHAAINIVREAIRDTNLTLNETKTKMATIYGKNWNLGLMTNKDNEVTVGWRNKERARATIHNFMADPNAVTPQQASEILGKLQYYRQIEPEYFDALFRKYSEKTGRNVRETIIKRIKGLQI